MAASDPRVLVIDAHALIASSLAMSLRHCGFERVTTVEPRALEPPDEPPSVHLAPGDIALVGLLYGDGRTALPLIRPLTERGCRVIVMASDQALPLAGECLDRGAEAILDKDMSFERLVDVLRRLMAGERAMTEEERAALLEMVERYETAEDAPAAALQGAH